MEVKTRSSETRRIAKIVQEYNADDTFIDLFLRCVSKQTLVNQVYTT